MSDFDDGLDLFGEPDVPQTEAIAVLTESEPENQPGTEISASNVGLSPSKKSKKGSKKKKNHPSSSASIGSLLGSSSVVSDEESLSRHSDYEISRPTANQSQIHAALSTSSSQPAGPKEKTKVHLPSRPKKRKEKKSIKKRPRKKRTSKN